MSNLTLYDKKETNRKREQQHACAALVRCN